MALPIRAAELERLFTSEEFEALPEFDERYELIDGRLVEKPMAGLEHGLIGRIIAKHYDRFDPDEKIGLVVAEVSTKLGPKDTPMPDLSFWTAAHRPQRTSGAAPRPDLAIEILSPRDLETRKRREEVQAKIRKYQATGVQIVWVINPKKQEVEVYHPNQAEPVQILKIDDELDGENIIPGFNISVRLLFK